MDTGKKILLFLTKSFIFSAVFWCSWIFVFNKVSSPYPKTLPLTSSDFGNDLDKIYEQQLRKTEGQLITVDSQQKRMEKLIEKYEDHVQRYEQVLQKWEQQTSVQK